MSSEVRLRACTTLARLSSARTLKVVSSVYNFTPQALEELAGWFEQRGLRTPISQIVGFKQFLGQTSTSVLTIETTTSTLYGDLATVGPTVSGLADGNYLVFHGCRSAIGVTDGSDQARMAIPVNGAAASDNECASSSWAGFMSVTMLNARKLTVGGNNTIQAKYKSNAGATAYFGTRWLIALRYGNV